MFASVDQLANTSKHHAEFISFPLFAGVWWWSLVRSSLLIMFWVHLMIFKVAASSLHKHDQKQQKMFGGVCYQMFASLV